jgi:hypothetical protein
MKKLISEVSGLIWTLAGTGLVLITMSGTTKTLGIAISAIALILHILTALLKSDE